MKKILIFLLTPFVLTPCFIAIKSSSYPTAYYTINSDTDEKIATQILEEEGFTQDRLYQSIQKRWHRKEIIGIWHISYIIDDNKVFSLYACYETPWNSCFRARHKEL